jgi:peroxiredoxin
LEREQPELRARGIEIIGIGPGGAKAADLTRRALKLTYGVYGDPTGEVYERFGFTRVLGIIQQSGTIAIDEQGKVRVAHRTANPADALALVEAKAALL